MKILLVDDERQLTSALSVILKQKKFDVDCANNGEAGFDMALTNIYDVIVLDIMMPKTDGITVLKKLRANKISTPILLLTAKGETEDKIYGLNMGADDYLAKPFDTNELIARIRALNRRKAEFTGEILEFNDISLNRDTLELCCNEHKISLGKKEFHILEMLIVNQGKSIDKERFIEKIWGYDTNAEYNTIEVYVSFIRKKLTALHSTTEIRSIRGFGYTLEVKND